MLRYNEEHSPPSAKCSALDIDRKPTASNKVYREGIERDKANSYSPKRTNWQEIDYPQYFYGLELSANEKLQFKNTYTISRHLCNSLEKSLEKACPYGDEKALIANLKKTNRLRIIRSAYELSALRFKLSPFKKEISTKTNKIAGIPTALRPLYTQLVDGLHQIDTDKFLSAASSQEFSNLVNKVQEKTKQWYFNELVPCINANPFDPKLYSEKPKSFAEILYSEDDKVSLSRLKETLFKLKALSPELIDDLTQYVQLENNPDLFFELMQWLEKDVITLRWQSFQAGKSLLIEDAIVSVMTNWCDRDGHKRKRPIKCPTGVPLSYMQSLRRKDQPFITQEFSDHAHGGLNHWLQEHIWQRFCYRYPEKCRLHPSEFFKQLGQVHFAFADSIYELHMPNVVNPANTNFWSVLQYYLPLMSPWP